MKFDKFVKKIMPNGITVTVDGTRYLTDGKVYAKIPAYLGSLGVESKDNKKLDAVLNDFDWGEKAAELTAAKLPFADSKAKDIIRIFDDGLDAVEISNEQFGLIEKSDMCRIAAGTIYSDEPDDTEGKDITALLIGSHADTDSFEPDAIIIND